MNKLPVEVENTTVSEEHDDTVKTWLHPATQNHYKLCLKIGHAWAILGGMVGHLGSTPNPPQTKPGRANPDKWFRWLNSHAWRRKAHVHRLFSPRRWLYTFITCIHCSSFNHCKPKILLILFFFRYIQNSFWAAMVVRFVWCGNEQLLPKVMAKAQKLSFSPPPQALF
jgi:hypothetical protein